MPTVRPAVGLATPVRLGGTTSVTTLPDEGSGPLLVSVRVQVRVAPGLKVAGPVLVIAISTLAPGDKAPSLLLLGTPVAVATTVNVALDDDGLATEIW